MNEKHVKACTIDKTHQSENNERSKRATITRELTTDVEWYLKTSAKRLQVPLPLAVGRHLTKGKVNTQQCVRNPCFYLAFRISNVHLSSIAESSKLIHTHVSSKSHNRNFNHIKECFRWSCCKSSMFAESVLLSSVGNMEMNSWRSR
jgi:hypothetical protein